MDHDAFRKTYNELDQRSCRFAKGIVSGHCHCDQAQSFNLAERGSIHCRSDIGHERCTELLKLLRHHSRFTLKENRENSILPHSKILKIEIGGLRGISAVVYKEEPPPQVIDNISQLIELAVAQFGDLSNLPFQEIIKQIAAFKGRPGSIV